MLRLPPRTPRGGGRYGRRAPLPLRNRGLALRERRLLLRDTPLELGVRGLLTRLAPLRERVDGDRRHRRERDERDDDHPQQAPLAAPRFLPLVH